MLLGHYMHNWPIDVPALFISVTLYAHERNSKILTVNNVYSVHMWYFISHITTKAEEYLVT